MISFTSLFAQERGKASFYSNRSHGKRMADGSVYDKSDYTCAHRKYPFGTLLKVTNLSNGKSVIVEVRDRGPYGRGRVVDLSYGAAKEIGMVQKGVAFVEVEKVPDNVIPLIFDPNCGLEGVDFMLPHEYTIPVIEYPKMFEKPTDFKEIPNNVKKHKTEEKGSKRKSEK